MPSILLRFLLDYRGAPGSPGGSCSRFTPRPTETSPSQHSAGRAFSPLGARNRWALTKKRCGGSAIPYLGNRVLVLLDADVRLLQTRRFKRRFPHQQSVPAHSQTQRSWFCTSKRDSRSRSDPVLCTPWELPGRGSARGTGQAVTDTLSLAPASKRESWDLVPPGEGSGQEVGGGFWGIP